jgi:hypothetical protein
VTEWAINIPHRSGSDSLLDVASDCRHLPDGDGDISRQIILSARIAGMETVGELTDRLAELGADNRRVVLDAARVVVGLPTTKQVDDERRYEVANESARRIAQSESPWQLCAACNAMSVNSLGVPVPTNVRKFWCAEHVHLAGPLDMTPRANNLRINEGGAIVEVDPAEIAREEEAARSRAARQAAAQADAEAAIAAAAADDEAMRAALRAELPESMRGLIA